MLVEKVKPVTHGEALFAPPPAGPAALDICEGRMSVTPAMARQMLAENNYDRQRPARAPHVAFLADEMRRGNFLGGSQIAFARLNGRLILVNGQHRMTAQVASNATVEYQVLIQDAHDAEDVSRYYYRQDRGQRVRSDSEVLAAVGVAQTYGLTATIARSVFQAAPLIENRFRRPSIHEDPTLRNDDLRLEACRPWWEVAEAYQYIIKAAPRLAFKKLVSSQALAVALVTLKHQPAKARAFWEGIAKDDGLHRGDARKALLIDFGNREWARNSSDGAIATSLAWNAYFADRTLSWIKFGSGPVRIAGTPYDGRKA